MNITWAEGDATYNRYVSNCATSTLLNNVYGFTIYRISFCSFPDKVCATYTRVSGGKAVLSLGYNLATPLTNVPQAICNDTENTLTQRGRVSNDTVGGAESMLYEVQAKVFSRGGNIRCILNSDGDAALEVSNATESWVVWSGETE